VLNVSAHWVSQNLSAHNRHWRMASPSSQELLGSYTSDIELFCRRLVTGQNVELPLGPVKQIKIHAVERRGSPHIYTNL